MWAGFPSVCPSAIASLGAGFIACFINLGSALTPLTIGAMRASMREDAAEDGMFSLFAALRYGVLVALVPIRPRSRCERRSLRTISSGVCFSPPTPRVRSRRTACCLSTPRLTPFNSAPTTVAVFSRPRAAGRCRMVASAAGRKGRRRRGPRRGGTSRWKKTKTKSAARQKARKYLARQ
ncbi:uncharacterized protein MICPUCDRAFT_52409 [Micromonas pusilla CCMP1545]|uniref:Predicted protein n=1 Tax=Micromonas pusilla (strain CCMP1545) TaxID=564608 RepID=C1N448_MICPC|nr:uncharacterized protein MICPUCDRAFT_52409 [Micromonas pusilla CCMP1545]EEH53302.1 predicted protein [Micromonas pusilla CCMP1545]|eukprot:XP_003062483.1 predicted protein [Micromonas pusilla CCMP1545]